MYLFAVSYKRPIGFIFLNSFFISLYFCCYISSFIAFLLYGAFARRISPHKATMSVCFSVRMHMRLLSPLCMSICMCRHASFSLTIFACLHAGLSVCLRAGLPACLCVYASSYMCLICPTACLYMRHSAQPCLFACLPLYICANRLHHMSHCLSVYCKSDPSYVCLSVCVYVRLSAC